MRETKELTLKITHIIFMMTLLIKNFQSNLVKIDKKPYKDLLCYY